MKRLLLLPLLALSLAANAQVKFQAKAIGWTITLPDGWKEHTREELSGIMGDATDAILLHLYKDETTNLMVMCDPTGKISQAGYEAEVDTMCKQMKQVMEKSMGIPTDTARSKETIDGKPFDVIEFTFHTPEPDKSTVFCTLINGKFVQISVTGSKEADKKELIRAIRESKFE